MPDSEANRTRTSDDRKLGPGAAYLQRKRETRDRTSRLRGKVHDAVEDLHRVLAAAAEHSRRYVLQDPRLSGHPPDLALNAAYLVEQSASSRFTRLSTLAVAVPAGRADRPLGAVLVRHLGGIMTLARRDDDLYLIDLLDRLLAGGVVLSGDVTISLAGVDLIQISVRALISSVSRMVEP